MQLFCPELRAPPLATTQVPLFADQVMVPVGVGPEPLAVAVKVIDEEAAFSLPDTTTVGVYLATMRVAVPEEPAYVVVPAYAAVTVLAPVGSEIDVEQLADPDDSEAEHRVVPPEVKVTVPVAADGVTVADSVSLEPGFTVDGLTLADVVVAFPLTIRVKANGGLLVPALLVAVKQML